MEKINAILIKIFYILVGILIGGVVLWGVSPMKSAQANLIVNHIDNEIRRTISDVPEMQRRWYESIDLSTLRDQLRRGYQYEIVIFAVSGSCPTLQRWMEEEHLKFVKNL